MKKLLYLLLLTSLTTDVLSTPTQSKSKKMKKGNKKKTGKKSSRKAKKGGSSIIQTHSGTPSSTPTTLPSNQTINENEDPFANTSTDLFASETRLEKFKTKITTKENIELINKLTSSDQLVIQNGLKYIDKLQRIPNNIHLKITEILHFNIRKFNENEKILFKALSKDIAEYQKLKIAEEEKIKKQEEKKEEFEELNNQAAIKKQQKKIKKEAKQEKIKKQITEKNEKTTSSLEKIASEIIEIEKQGSINSMQGEDLIYTIIVDKKTINIPAGKVYEEFVKAIYAEYFIALNQNDNNLQDKMSSIKKLFDANLSKKIRLIESYIKRKLPKTSTLYSIIKDIQKDINSTYLYLTHKDVKSEEMDAISELVKNIENMKTNNKTTETSSRIESLEQELASKTELLINNIIERLLKIKTQYIDTISTKYRKTKINDFFGPSDDKTDEQTIEMLKKTWIDLARQNIDLEVKFAKLEEIYHRRLPENLQLTIFDKSTRKQYAKYNKKRQANVDFFNESKDREKRT